MIVYDNGKGFVYLLFEIYEFKGFSLVVKFVEYLNGKIVYMNDNGCRVVIEILL